MPVHPACRPVTTMSLRGDECAAWMAHAAAA
jgi:hypothetical protein